MWKVVETKCGWFNIENENGELYTHVTPMGGRSKRYVTSWRFDTVAQVICDKLNAAL